MHAETQYKQIWYKGTKTQCIQHLQTFSPCRSYMLHRSRLSTDSQNEVCSLVYFNPRSTSLATDEADEAIGFCFDFQLMGFARPTRATSRNLEPCSKHCRLKLQCWHQIQHDLNKALNEQTTSLTPNDSKTNSREEHQIEWECAAATSPSIDCALPSRHRRLHWMKMIDMSWYVLCWKPLAQKLDLSASKRAFRMPSDWYSQISSEAA